MTAARDGGDLPGRARRTPTTVLSDLLADRGLRAQVVSPTVQAAVGTGRVAGWAFTVTGGPAAADESGPDLAKAQAIDAMTAGQVAVWAGGDVDEVCLFGDLLAAGQRARGVLAAVVDGGIRDEADIDGTGLVVWARYRTPKASTGIWRVRGWQEPVEVGGTSGGTVRVVPGDLVVADVDGVVVLPADVAAEVVAAAERYADREAVIRARIEAGESMAALVAEFGRL